MSKPRMNDRIVVVDLEATCWKQNNEETKDWLQEIIEIGVCELDVKSLKRLDRASYLCQPQESRVTEFCTELTGHTAEVINRCGARLDVNLDQFRQRFSTRRRVWASYGDYDRRQFQRECGRKGLGYPFGTRHLNVKTLFALVHNLDREVGMDKALEILNVPLIGRHHNGADDAWNIAGILARIFAKCRGITLTPEDLE